MIEWVDEKCRIWGRQKRRIAGLPRELHDERALCLLQPRQTLVRGVMESGNARGILGRVVEEGPVGAAIQNSAGRRFPEGMTGDALQVSIAIQKALYLKEIADHHYEAMLLYYVQIGPLKQRLEDHRLNRKTMYDRLHKSHSVIEQWLDGDNVTSDSVAILG